MKERKQNSTTYPASLLMVSNIDHITAVTGATLTVTVSKNGGSFVAASGAVSEIGNGWYSLAGHASDRDTLGSLIIHASATGADPVDDRYVIVPWDPFDANLSLSNLDAAVSTRSTYAGTDTAGTTTLVGRLTSGRASNLDNLDASVSSRSVYGGGDTAGTTTLLSRIASALTITGGKVDVNDKSGFSLSSSGIQAIWDFLVSSITAVGSIGKRLVDNIDAAISSRSTYAGGDTAGTTTLLSRLTSGRATGLDYLDASVSSRSTYTGTDTAGTTTLLTRLSAIRAGYLDNLTRLDATISSISGSTVGDSPGVTTLLGRLTSTRAGYMDNLTRLDVNVSSRSTFNVSTQAVTVGTNNDKTGYRLDGTYSTILLPVGYNPPAHLLQPTGANLWMP